MSFHVGNNCPFSPPYHFTCILSLFSLPLFPFYFSVPILGRGMNCYSCSGMAHSQQPVLQYLAKGWRFHPTDQELLLDYLKPAILGMPIDGSDVKQIDISNLNPLYLFGQCNDKQQYFLSPREYLKNHCGLRKRKVRDGGYWKCTGDPRPIILEDSEEEVIGMKRSLVFHNPDATEFSKTEYLYTAHLNGPITGNYVLYKLKKKPIKKKILSSKKSTKAEPVGKKTRLNKKARKGESSNCNLASAFESNHLKGMVANSPCGEGEQSNHFDSYSENQYPSMITSMSTYEKDTASCAVASDSASNKYATSSLVNSYIKNQNSEQITIVSANNKGDKMTDMSMYKKCNPSCQRASCVENQNSFEMTISSHYKDETSSLTNQNLIDVTTKLLYNKSNTGCLVTSDFEIQNPSEKMDISASEEGERTPLAEMPSDFGNQNQSQKIDVSFPVDYGSLSMASKVSETTIHEVQSQDKMTVAQNLEDYPGPSKIANVGENIFEEVQSQCKNIDVPDFQDSLGLSIPFDLDEDANCPEVDPQQLQHMITILESALQQPIHSIESPNLNDFGVPNNHNNTDVTIPDDSRSPLPASGAGGSTISAKDDEELDKLLSNFY